ncbi:glycerate kinase [Mycobacteroides abscessus subsp. abscessus]|nr:glycerate kinase [Mycobacteroides abscessus subsp. abscessus]HEO8420681.1 glycerate kinase [Yersinia enterocolitica]
MTAREACEAMERGIKKANNRITCLQVPMADGGESTMELLVNANKGKIYNEKVLDPLGREVTASYGILEDSQTGIIDMASASGIHLVAIEERNPLITTTYGTGQLIKACLDHNIKKLIVGIGGSATNDGGAGLVQALGGKFFDENGKELGFGGGELGRLARIDIKNLDPRIKDLSVEVACDVNNPLCGEQGASYVFGPQKGATLEIAQQLDRNLMNYAAIIKEEFHIDILNVPGAGAAGGLGAGLMVFLNGTLKKGIDIVIRYSSLEEKVKGADMVWTGEGCIDFQTKFGKTPIGVASVAKKYNKPVVAFAGKIGNNIDSLYEKIDSIFCIMQGVTTLEEALANGKQNLERTSENMIRSMNLVM